MVKAWRADPRVQKKRAASTLKSYRREMDALLEKNADKDVRNTTCAGVRALHDTLSASPRKADWRLQMVRLLWNYAQTKLDWPLGPNPAADIEIFGRQKEFEPWPGWMVAKLDSAPDRVRTMADLILGTRQRPNAAILMEHDHFSGEWMSVLDEKGGERIEVFCPSSLRTYLDGRPRTGRYILAKNLT